MEAIKLIDGVKITDMFLGISATREEGETGRYELSALPKEALSALGTKMFVVLEFDESFKQPDGVMLKFQYDAYPEIQTLGVDKIPVGKKTFDILPPYKSQKIKKPGNHTLTVAVSTKNLGADGELSISEDDIKVQIPYKVVA